MRKLLRHLLRAQDSSVSFSTLGLFFGIVTGASGAQAGGSLPIFSLKRKLLER
jgi:hypothetical protein